MRTAATLLCLSGLAVGCSATTSSTNIRTAGVVAVINVTSERDNDAVVGAEMVVGDASSNTYLVLEGGDALVAGAGGEKKTLSAVGGGDYEARFPVSEGEFIVALEREGDDDAPMSRGTLGPAFTIDNPQADTPISRESGTWTITWTPADPGAEVEVELDGDCVIRESERLGTDTGSFTVAPGQLRPWKSKKDQTCAVDVQITRTRMGETDPALDRDSRFLLHQIRRTRFISAP